MIPVRTTLNLDEDVLEIAKQLAQQKRTTTGQIISELVRQALQPKAAPRMRNGVPLFEPKPGERRPSLALVNRLRDGG